MLCLCVRVLRRTGICFILLLLYSSRGTAVSKNRKEIADSRAWYRPYLDVHCNLRRLLEGFFGSSLDYGPVACVFLPPFFYHSFITGGVDEYEGCLLNRSLDDLPVSCIATICPFRAATPTVCVFLILLHVVTPFPFYSPLYVFF